MPLARRCWRCSTTRSSASRCVGGKTFQRQAPCSYAAIIWPSGTRLFWACPSCARSSIWPRRNCFKAGFWGGCSGDWGLFPSGGAAAGRMLWPTPMSCWMRTPLWACSLRAPARKMGGFNGPRPARLCWPTAQRPPWCRCASPQGTGAYPRPLSAPLSALARPLRPSGWPFPMIPACSCAGPAG